MDTLMVPAKDLAAYNRAVAPYVRVITPEFAIRRWVVSGGIIQLEPYVGGVPGEDFIAKGPNGCCTFSWDDVLRLRQQD